MNYSLMVPENVSAVETTVPSHGGISLEEALVLMEEAYFAAVSASFAHLVTPETTLAAFGALNIAFNNAGALGAMGSVADVSLEGWRDTLDTNLTSAFLGAKYQVPAMLARGGGSIVFTSSFVGSTVGFPGMAAYAASKFGLRGLHETLVAEYRGSGVRLTLVSPGPTDTDMWDGVDLEQRPELTPRFRMLRPNDVVIHSLKPGSAEPWTPYRMIQAL